MTAITTTMSKSEFRHARSAWRRDIRQMRGIINQIKGSITEDELEFMEMELIRLIVEDPMSKFRPELERLRSHTDFWF